MYLPQTEIEYRNALIDAAEIGARKALEAIAKASNRASYLTTKER